MTHHVSRPDFQFHGNWLVNYDPKEFKYPDILITLAQIQDKFNEFSINFNSININFNKNGDTNYFYQENNDFFLSFCGSDKVFEKVETKPCEPAAMEPLEKPIKTVSLLFPRLENDPRWKTMGLPAAQSFLAANLQANGFQPAPMPLSLPNVILPAAALAADMAGFTAFEDLLPSLRPFLAQFKANYDGWIAAGGPFPTLAPLAAVYHLPQVNLFVRGEAEMVLPGVLDALNRGDAEGLSRHQGVFWQQPGLIVMSAFDWVNRPETFSSFRVDLAFIAPEHLAHGLEMNFSRGCSRGCVFCCRAQGNTFRKLPLDKAEELLKQYRDKVDQFSDIGRGVPLERPGCVTESAFPDMAIPDEPGRPTGSPLPLQESPVFIPININDDDILQDPDYAAAVFALIKRNNFRIIGIQTSPAALVQNNGQVKTKVLALAADPELYLENRPLLWLGTDVFLPQRARRLGKRLPSPEGFAGLLAQLEKRGLRHFHYWISSDGDSTWEEFVEELVQIVAYHRDFPNFALLAHAPFIVPYPASMLFGRLPAGDPKLKLKLELHAPDPRFSFKVVERLETKYANLNILLRNENSGNDRGFFDFLKAMDFMAAAQLAYYYLRQEELQNPELDPILLRARKKLENTIRELLELRNA